MERDEVDFLLLSDNLPFSLAIAFVVLLGIVEGISMVLGVSLFGLLDDLSPIDLDADVDTGVTGITGVVGWLCLDRLPLLIWLVLMLTSFAIAGFSINYIALIVYSSLPVIISLPIALLFTALSCRFLGAKLASLLPKNESSAISVDELSGLVGVITVGCARRGFPSEAAVRDGFNQKHYVLVEPEFEAFEFPKGTQVVLLQRVGKVWSAAKIND
ncbi:YqiJ family protein [Shewanella psychrotolerans]|uniref:YqiJ family protein n=1 Tax=Shewanella psychrotolerans TaxID=2864206 RepID=UPI001C660194|nr:YqiJ family protein [Shewanella psychrotolerans]QYK02206.1 YqiJ family protein [Shewanella psychrotolerans]